MPLLEKLLGREFPRVHDLGADGMNLPTTHAMSRREKLGHLFEEKVVFPLGGPIIVIGAVVNTIRGREPVGMD